MSEIEQPRPRTISRLPGSEWRVDTLRLTAFPLALTEVEYSSWWETVFREPPEIQTTEPRRSRHREESSFENGRLILQVEPRRIDWQWGSAQPGEDQIPNIERFPGALDRFCEFMARWFEAEQCPILRRIAFGAVLLYPVDNREAGYRQLQPYLHNLTLDPVHSSDLLYQINRPRNSNAGLAGLRINRLSRWSVASFRPFSLEIGPLGTRSLSGSASFACRLEVDINTIADSQGELDRRNLQPIFQELVGLGDEILREGDIP